MKSQLHLLTLALLTGSLASFGASTASAQSCDHSLNATYQVTFDAAWSQQNHPADFPGNPHFSGLIGGTHQGSHSFWEVGSLASPGIESMAETGSKTSLTSEVNSAISNGTAEFLLSGGSIGTSPGSVSMTFNVTSDFPAVTLVSMVAPSPDWFVGVDGLELFQNGMWQDQIVVDLAAYDSGTDSGTMYTSANSDTNPADPIFEITGYPFFGVSLGTFTFTKISSEDLALCVDPLVSGQSSTFRIAHGTPQENVVIMWSRSLGSTVASSGSWCVDFGIDVSLGNPFAQSLALGPFDGSGEFQVTRQVPPSALGLSIYLQAAEQNACPDPRMSNIVMQVIQ